MQTRYITQFAQTYGGSAYGTCAYNDSGACTSTGVSTSPTTGSSLVNTGFVVLIIATIACLLIFAAIVVRFWRRPSKLVAQPVRIDDEDGQDDQSQG